MSGYVFSDGMQPIDLLPNRVYSLPQIEAQRLVKGEFQAWALVTKRFGIPFFVCVHISMVARSLEGSERANAICIAEHKIRTALANHFDESGESYHVQTGRWGNHDPLLHSASVFVSDTVPTPDGEVIGFIYPDRGCYCGVWCPVCGQSADEAIVDIDRWLRWGFIDHGEAK